MISPEHLTRACWCGALLREIYSDRYCVCVNCGTLVSKDYPPCGIEKVNDEENDFYGKNYYLKYTIEKYGFAKIESRARTELSERCLYWLRTLLKYKLPPARVLEIGSSHGGFVAMMRWAGYDATGLELSRWVASFGQTTFGIPMLVGPLEDQHLKPGTFDIIVLMDVLEHFPDPLRTMTLCCDLLRSDGLLLIQTPSFPENKSYEQLIQECHPFQKMLIEEHLYLFSERSMKALLNNLDMVDVRFEKAIFFEYDMFIVASKSKLAVRDSAEIADALMANSGTRMIQAMLDLDDYRKSAAGALNDCEDDRAARLQVIHRQGREFAERLNASEADRDARLETIKQQGEMIKQQEENMRQQAETIRQQAETIRQQAETIKQQAETIKQQEENIRQQGETISRQEQAIRQMGIVERDLIKELDEKKVL